VETQGEYILPKDRKPAERHSAGYVSMMDESVFEVGNVADHRRRGGVLKTDPAAEYKPLTATVYESHFTGATCINKFYILDFRSSPKTR
jgi:poly(3-hydroxyalkanoate) synthetase